MTYYTLSCLITGPLFPILIVPAFFRYHTMRYRFDSEGVSMRWGILFRKEIILNYSRIQDIHLSSNIVERWLGLARLQIQTASGSASAEMTIEGIEEYETLRDFLYSQMRGQKERRRVPDAPHVDASSATLGANPEATEQVTAALRTAAGELRSIRLLLETKQQASRATLDADANAGADK